MKLSRRQLIQLLSSAPLLSCGAADLAGTSSGNARAKDGRESVIVRRVLIPAQGMTLPVVLARPAEGHHPAVILLEARDDQEILRRCADVAAAGFVLIAPLRMHDKNACLTAIQRYARNHPAVLGTPRIVSL